MGLPDSENCVEFGCTYSVGDISISKASLADRQAAHTQVCPLFKKELRPALRSLLVGDREAFSYRTKFK